MSKLSKYGIIALKGFAMGAGSVTPCVSAGTIALLTGIYEPFINSLESFSRPQTWKALFTGRFKEFWKIINGNFLLALTAGLAISVILLAKVAAWGLATYPIQTWAFFFGLIIASTVILLKGIEGKTIFDVIYIAIGIALGIGIFCLTPTSAPEGLWYIFLCGAVSICTMILPGIAGSFVLQIMGRYETMMNALDFQAPNWPVLIVFAFGCVVGILAFSKFLKWLMGKWEKQTLLILTGFVIGSLTRIWPYSDMAKVTEAQILRTGSAGTIDYMIPGAIIFCIIGVALVVLIQIIGTHKKAE